MRLNPLEQEVLPSEQERNRRLYDLFSEMVAGYGGRRPERYLVSTYRFPSDDDYQQSLKPRIVGVWRTDGLTQAQMAGLEAAYADVISPQPVEGSRRFEGGPSRIVSYVPCSGPSDPRRRGYFIRKFAGPVHRAERGIWVTRDFASAGMAREAPRKRPREWFYGPGSHTVELRCYPLTEVGFMELGLQVSHVLAKGDRIPRKQLLYDVYRRLMLLDMEQHRKEDVAGMDKLIDDLLWRVFAPAANAEAAERLGYRPESVLLAGVPGTGKTLLGQVLMGTPMDALFVPIDAWALIETQIPVDDEPDVFASLDALRKNAGVRAVLYVDDIEAALVEPELSDAGKENRAATSTLLNHMRGMLQDGVPIIGSTNNPWDIDQRFLEFGRFGRVVYFPLPDESTRKDIIGLHLRDRPLAADVDAAALAAKTEGWTGRHLSKVCEDAGRFASRRAAGGDIAKLRELTGKELEGIVITNADIEDAYRVTAQAIDLGAIKRWDAGIRKFCEGYQVGALGFSSHRL